MLGVHSAPLASDLSAEHWRQRCTQSILKPELPWERNCIEAPTICLRVNTYVMFYAGAYNNEPQQIGVAFSQHGLAWERMSDRPFLANGKTDEWNSSESGHPGIFVDRATARPGSSSKETAIMGSLDIFRSGESSGWHTSHDWRSSFTRLQTPRGTEVSEVASFTE